MIKAAFFDIDGTLLSFATHRVPDSAWAAINAMRERGIKVFIATGRERDMIPDVVATGFDGYVTINGQSCFDENGEFRHQSIDPEGVRLVVEQVEAGLYEALFMTKGYSFVSGHSPRVLHNERHCGLTYAVADPRSALDLEIMQMCAYLGEDEEHIVAEGNPHVHTTRWCDDFCDVMPVGGGKPEGVQAMCERYGLTLDEAVAFGDGGNDIAMLRAVGTGVAMGNAGDNVKAAADLVTTDVDNDGIWNACVELGLIEG